ncbi:MAG: DsbA family protein [Actinomycetales bacterium]
MTRVVEVFAEVGCPFAYVGLTRMLAERDRREADVIFRIRAWPLELVNGEPMDPEHIVAEVADIRRQVAPDLFADTRVETFPATSLPAFALISAAYAHSDQVGERVAMQVRRAIFENGENVSHPQTLSRIADQFGVQTPADSDLVEGEYAMGRERGVVGSPHVFVDGYSVFCPSLSISKQDDGHFVVNLDAESTQALMQRIFSSD